MSELIIVFIYLKIKFNLNNLSLFKCRSGLLLAALAGTLIGLSTIDL